MLPMPSSSSALLWLFVGGAAVGVLFVAFSVVVWCALLFVVVWC